MAFGFNHGLTGMAMLACSLGVAAQQWAYVSSLPASRPQAYLVSSLSEARAWVVNGYGRSKGRVETLAGGGRRITLDKPIVYGAPSKDSCGSWGTVKRHLQEVVIHPLDGTRGEGHSSVAELGVQTWLIGCEQGKTEPFGSADALGEAMVHREMSRWPATSDLLPGTQLAGVVEVENPDHYTILPQDILEFLPDRKARFLRSGTVVPYMRAAGRWYVLALAGFERGYARIAVDSESGGETWLIAEWADGAPAAVSTDLLAKVQPDAEFGNVMQTARQWQHTWSGDTPLVFTNLYENGQGQRLQRDSPGGQVNFAYDLDWKFDGRNVVQDYLGTDGYPRQRTWQPVAVRGTFRFVMESETIDPLVGSGPEPYIAPRLVYFEDFGAAVLPSAGSGKRASIPSSKNWQADRR